MKSVQKPYSAYLCQRKHLTFWMGILLLHLFVMSTGCEQTVRETEQTHTTPQAIQELPEPVKETPILRTAIPDFSRIRDTEERKRSFFSFMRPFIEWENAKIIEKREMIMELHEKHLDQTFLTPEEIAWLNKIKKEYRVKWTYDDPEFFWPDLLRRIDKLPVELALIQAAKESGWGTSRFALSGNNIFGQWCFRKGCGIVPENRPEGANHEVRKFNSVSDSVRSYIHNLNTHAAYEGMRLLRQEYRRLGLEPDGYDLAAEIIKYSERGEAYLEEVRAMIRANRRFMGS